MEYMTIGEVRANAGEIRVWFETLMAKPSLVTKKGAHQWQFFRKCLDCTLGPSANQSHNWPAQKIVHYKFEVEKKLRSIYTGAGAPLPFVFRIFSEREALSLEIVLDETYPKFCGYFLLIRDRRDVTDDEINKTISDRDQIEKFIVDCVDAEFDAYLALPAVKKESLAKFFLLNGPAYNDLINTLTLTGARSWILNNPGNPSTRQIFNIRINEIENDAAIVKSTQHWYFRYWSLIEKKYPLIFRETIRITYFLKKIDGSWFIENHIQPKSISSTPHRNKKL